MFALVETDDVNNEQRVTTGAGEFMIQQRNMGYEVNDGKWVATQLPELYRGGAGEWRQRRPEYFLGVFGTPVDMVEAIVAAPPRAVCDRVIYAY